MIEHLMNRITQPRSGFLGKVPKNAGKSKAFLKGGDPYGIAINSRYQRLNRRFPQNTRHNISMGYMPFSQPETRVFPTFHMKG